MPEHLDQAQHGPDDADGRGVAAHVGEQLRRRLVDGALGVDLGGQDDGDLFGVGAVDGQLQAAAQELVLHLGGLGLQGQQALPAGPAGQPDQGLHRVVGLRGLGGEGPDQLLGQRADIAHHGTGDGGADGAAEDQDHRRDQEDGTDVAAFHGHRADDGDDRQDDADDQGRIHQESFLRIGTTGGWAGEPAVDSTRIRGWPTEWPAPASAYGAPAVMASALAMMLAR